MSGNIGTTPIISGGIRLSTTREGSLGQEGTVGGGNTGGDNGISNTRGSVTMSSNTNSKDLGNNSTNTEDSTRSSRVRRRSIETSEEGVVMVDVGDVDILEANQIGDLYGEDNTVNRNNTNNTNNQDDDGDPNHVI